MAYDVLKGKEVPGDWACGIEVSFPEKQKREVLSKIDQMRSDVRQTGGRLGTGLFALAAAVGLVGVALFSKGR